MIKIIFQNKVIITHEINYKKIRVKLVLKESENFDHKYQKVKKNLINIGRINK